MPNNNRRYKINFNLVLDNETDTALIRIAADQGTSKAHVLRSLIRDRHTMKYAREPLCSTGEPCRCPHTHIYPPSHPTASANLAETMADVAAPSTTATTPPPPS